MIHDSPCGNIDQLFRPSPNYFCPCYVYDSFKLTMRVIYPESCVSRRSYAKTLVKMMTLLNRHETIQSTRRLTNCHCLPYTHIHTHQLT